MNLTKVYAYIYLFYFYYMFHWFLCSAKFQTVVQAAFLWYWQLCPALCPHVAYSMYPLPLALSFINHRTCTLFYWASVLYIAWKLHINNPRIIASPGNNDPVCTGTAGIYRALSWGLRSAGHYRGTTLYYLNKGIFWRRFTFHAVQQDIGIWPLLSNLSFKLWP